MGGGGGEGLILAQHVSDLRQCDGCGKEGAKRIKGIGKGG